VEFKAEDYLFNFAYVAVPQPIVSRGYGEGQSDVRDPTQAGTRHHPTRHRLVRDRCSVRPDALSVFPLVCVVLKGGDSVRDPHRASRVLCASDVRPHPTTCDSYSSNARELHASCGVRVRIADFDTHGARWLHAGCDRLLRFDDGTIHIDQRADLKPRRALEIQSLLWQRAPCLRSDLAIATRSSLIPRLEQ
jgi:hypothetical protein